MSSFKAVLLSSAILAADLVAGHGGIVRAVGSAGGESMGLGIDPNTPRDGTNRRPFQMDSTRFQGEAAGTVGETLAGGANDIETGTKAIMGMTGQSLAQVAPGGALMMTLHQVNADGAGPYTCMINADGTAQDWENIQVTQNIDGNQRGRNRDGNMQDLPLNVQIPANQQCTGQVAGQQNVCMVRCQNPARAGPFGGVVPVQMAGAAAGANSNAAAPAGASATGAAPAAAPTTAAAKPGAAGKAAGAGAAAKGAAGAGAAKGAGKAAGGRNGRNGKKAQNNNKRAAFVKRIDPVTQAVEFTA